MTDGSLLIYGATGYMGNLVARSAVASSGIPVILAARDAKKLEGLASPLGCEWRPFSLDDPETLDRGLSGAKVVLNTAGPFSATASPMIEACLRTRTHYLDITGEIDVLEATAARNAEATRAGIVLMPGVGFDVVPSDCLAVHLKTRMPDAKHLAIAISATGGISRGTALTGIQGIGQGTRVRRDGRIIALAKPPRRQTDFGNGVVNAIAVSWGDVATAYYSTAIPNVTVFFHVGGVASALAGMGTVMRKLLSTAAARALLNFLVRSRLDGPSEERRAASRAILVGEVKDAEGNVLRSRLQTPGGYAVTIQTSLAAAQRLLSGGVAPGFHTPASAFGPDFILEFPGTAREDL